MMPPDLDSRLLAVLSRFHYGVRKGVGISRESGGWSRIFGLFMVLLLGFEVSRVRYSSPCPRFPIAMSANTDRLTGGEMT